MQKKAKQILKCDLNTLHSICGSSHHNKALSKTLHFYPYEYHMTGSIFTATGNVLQGSMDAGKSIGVTALTV